MNVILCDRCNRRTKNKPAFLLPNKNQNDGSYNCNGVWWGEPIILCNNCLQDFEDFRISHSFFNKDIIQEDEI